MFSTALGEHADLRPLEPWQAGQFLALIEREREDFGAWLPWAVAIDDTEKARSFLQRYADSQAIDGGRIYAIWLDDVMVGGLLFRVFNVRSGVCEMGAWLAASAGGRGLATVAADLLVDWAFARGMCRVEWHAAATNLPSLRVAQRLGMTRDGVMRQAFPLRGVRHDVEVWSLLSSDARPNR
jgi:ribosomal-protein-serine acetyltransferase